MDTIILFVFVVSVMICNIFLTLVLFSKVSSAKQTLQNEQISNFKKNREKILAVEAQMDTLRYKLENIENLNSPPVKDFKSFIDEWGSFLKLLREEENKKRQSLYKVGKAYDKNGNYEVIITKVVSIYNYKVGLIDTHVITYVDAQGIEREAVEDVFKNDYKPNNVKPKDISTQISPPENYVLPALRNSGWDFAIAIGDSFITYEFPINAPEGLRSINNIYQKIRSSLGLKEEKGMIIKKGKHE